jgi:hypothetical protein
MPLWRAAEVTGNTEDQVRYCKIQGQEFCYNLRQGFGPLVDPDGAVEVCVFVSEVDLMALQLIGVVPRKTIWSLPPTA